MAPRISIAKHALSLHAASPAPELEMRFGVGQLFLLRVTYFWRSSARKLGHIRHGFFDAKDFLILMAKHMYKLAVHFSLMSTP
jgi:hypothetical protein